VNFSCLRGTLPDLHQQQVWSYYLSDLNTFMCASCRDIVGLSANLNLDASLATGERAPSVEHWVKKD